MLFLFSLSGGIGFLLMGLIVTMVCIGNSVAEAGKGWGNTFQKRGLVNTGFWDIVFIILFQVVPEGVERHGWLY